MKKRKAFTRNLSWFLSLMFIFAFLNIPQKIRAEEGKEQIAADAMANLTGDFLKVQGIGEDWKPELHNIVMKEFTKGIYFYTVEFKNPGKYNYKIAMNGSWSENYGKDGEKGGANIELNIDSAKTVSFLFDYKNKKIHDSVNDPQIFKNKATLVGTLAQNGGQDWVPSDEKYDLDYIGQGYFVKKFTLKAGNYEYKTAYDHKWSNGEVGDNVSLKLDKDSEVTFLSNPYADICVDSINNPEILNQYALIGTIRNSGDNNWNEKLDGFNFSYVGKGQFIYSAFIPKNSEGKPYEYKVAVNKSWDGGGIPSAGNNSISISDEGKYVVFICDVAKGKLYDSINNPDEIATILGLKKEPTVLKSPVINPNGSVTFNFKAPEADKVYLAGSMTDWASNKKIMTKDKDGLWSITLRLGDEAKNYEYKFIVGEDGWTKDPLNDKVSNGNSLLEFPKYEGRKVVIAGTIQSAAGETNWTPSSEKTKMQYKGNGLYEYILKNVPAGRYEYKVAMGAWDPENYGLNGKSYGENIPLTVDKTQDIIFLYNDDSHFIVDSVNYKRINAVIKGTGIKETLLEDARLTGIYSTKLELSKGLYNDLVIEVRDNKGNTSKTIKLPTIDIKEDKKVVTISFDPITEMAFNDASNEKININELYFDSKAIEYKKPFGAVKQNEEVIFSIKTLKDEITMAKMVITSPEGTEVLEMSKNGKFDDNHDRWTLKKSFNKLGTYKYYFIVTNGSDVKAYGDDDGYFGTGKADDLGKVKDYEFNVFKGDFKTPEWMKNAVVYQIFPDRFFDGDVKNNFMQKYARGFAPYEIYNDWYAIPENPHIAYEKDDKGNFKLDANGKPIVKKDYKGTVGDGYLDIWCNEMYGGDLVGIKAKLDYLQALGVNVLYLNPVSKSISNHRYDTTDYREVDPLLGKMEDFIALAKEAKSRGMHLILDGVYNHVSDDSIYFDRYGKYIEKNKPIGAYQYWSKVYDLMNEKGINQQEAEKQVTASLASMGITDLHYKDWFKVDNVKVNVGKPSEHYQYEGWWGYDSMPVIQALNGSEYKIETWANEIIDGKDSNTRYWLNQGSNGWRLDVANEVSDETWQNFRKAVKEEGNDNVIIGEIWTDASKYLLGDMYDSVMNYRFREAVLGFLRDNKPASEITKQLELIREQYPEEAFKAMLNLVDSHDTERILTSLDGIVKDKNDAIIAEEASEKAKKLQQLVPIIQMTYPGAPCIYYGDEIGMVGAKDPDDRRGMNWGKGDKATVERYALLANLRNNYEVLRTGDVAPASTDNENILAYERYLDNSKAVVLVNRGEKETLAQVNLKHIANGTKLTDAITGNVYTVADGKVSLKIDALEGAVLLTGDVKVSFNNKALKDGYNPEYIVKDLSERKSVELPSTGNKDLNTEKLPKTGGISGDSLIFFGALLCMAGAAMFKTKKEA